jgi:predicted phosphodiesterase
MRALILSDIHANLEALQAVLAAAEGQWDELWNLGDLVGYGGSPNQVIETMRPLETLVVRGNHDRVCCGLTSPNGFNPTARLAALWTRNELSAANLEWLRGMPQGPVQPQQEGVTCVHGSPLDEDSYILNMRDAWAPLQQMTTPVTFFGHTHVQGGFSQKDHVPSCSLRPGRQSGTHFDGRTARPAGGAAARRTLTPPGNAASHGQARTHNAPEAGQSSLLRWFPYFSCNFR